MPRTRLDYGILRGLYVDCGVSIRELARREQTHRGTIWNFLKREAAKRGDPWPLRQPLPIAKATVHSRVPSCGVGGFIDELHARGVTYRAIAHTAGVAESVVSRMAGPNPHHKTIRRTTATKLMKAVDHFEALLAEEKAA